MIADSQCRIGENPLWHPVEKLVYWTDIAGGKLFRYDPASGRHEECYSGAPVGGFTVQADGTLLLFMELGAIAVWRDGIIDRVVREIPAEIGYRFNDVIADPFGRVYCGTVSLKAGVSPGRLYRLDVDGSVHPMLEDVSISNGMGFTPDLRRMYYTDSGRRVIYISEYDKDTGTLTGQRAWLRIAEGAGIPDGMTVDAQGYVWSARWDGAALYRYGPGGVEDRRIDFPAKKVSSVIFGGEDLRDMYVTTALGEGTRAEEGAGAGALYRLRPGVRGLPEFFSRILL
jgi:sugar lactone lactonase YvrE